MAELLSEYDRGALAYDEGKALDRNQSLQWRTGWTEAESRDNKGWDEIGTGKGSNE